MQCRGHGNIVALSDIGLSSDNISASFVFEKYYGYSKGLFGHKGINGLNIRYQHS